MNSLTPRGTRHRLRAVFPTWRFHAAAVQRTGFGRCTSRLRHRWRWRWPGCYNVHRISCSFQVPRRRASTRERAQRLALAGRARPRGVGPYLGLIAAPLSRWSDETPVTLIGSQGTVSLSRSVTKLTTNVLGGSAGPSRNRPRGRLGSKAVASLTKDDQGRQSTIKENAVNDHYEKRPRGARSPHPRQYR